MTGFIVISSIIGYKEGNLTSTDLIIFEDVEQLVYNIGAGVTAKGITHCKDDVVDLVIVPKVVNNNPKKV